MNIVTTGKINSQRGIIREREILLNDLRPWHGGISSVKLMHNTCNHGLQRDIGAIWQGYLATHDGVDLMSPRAM